MDCRRWAVDDDRSRRKWAVNEDRRRIRWAIDEDLHRRRWTVDEGRRRRIWAVDDERRSRRRRAVDDEEDDYPRLQLPLQWRDPLRAVDRDRRSTALRVAQLEASLDRIDALFVDFNRSLERICTSADICTHSLTPNLTSKADYALVRPPLPHDMPRPESASTSAFSCNPTSLPRETPEAIYPFPLNRAPPPPRTTLTEASPTELQRLLPMDAAKKDHSISANPNSTSAFSHDQSCDLKPFQRDFDPDTTSLRFGKPMPDLTLMCNLRMCSIKEEVLKGKKDASKEKSMDVSFVQIELYNNSLAGHLTVKPSNLTALHQIYAPMNHFSFSIPNDILTIPNHENLRPYQNQLTDSITRTAASESKLLELHSLVSYILGSFPARLGAHFHLMSVKLFKKHLFVDIPRGIDVCCLLQELLLVEKDFTITLPSGLSIAEITTNDMEACGKATGSGNVFTIGVKIPGLKLIAKDDPSLCSQAVRCYVTKGFYTKFVINRDKVNITHGDRVKSLLKFNEPRVVAALGYDNGIFAPGRCTSCTVGGNSTTEPYIIAHNLILLHTTAEKV